MNLIVRVKRRRSQEPEDSIWIVDDAGAPTKKRNTADELSTGISDMSTQGLSGADGPASSHGRMLLRRVRTLDANDTVELDSHVLATMRPDHKRKHVGGETDRINHTDASKNVWVTNGKRVVRNAATAEKFVVVDIAQFSHDRPGPEASRDAENRDKSHTANATSGTPPSMRSSPSKTTIMSPALRKLDSAIEKALLSADFSEMAQAMNVGADINHRRQSDGCTALMAATLHRNTRMVTRLIGKGADVFLEDKSGCTAIDYLQLTKIIESRPNLKSIIDSRMQQPGIATLFHKSGSEIMLLLQKTAARVEQAVQRRKQRLQSQFPGEDDEESAGQSTSDDYVVDIFYRGTESSSDSGAEGGMEQQQPHDSNAPVCGDQGGAANGTQSSDDLLALSAQAPVIQVEGLQITSGGNVELVFEYDSDWSDLADDEDPDSNDERYHGNDYPEEQDGDGEEDEDDDGTEEDRYAGLRENIEDMDFNNPDDGDSDEDEDEDEDGSSFRNRSHGSKRAAFGFNQNSVGRVLRPQMLGGEASAIPGYAPHDSKSLQMLWDLEAAGEGGEEDNDDEEDDDDGPVDEADELRRFHAERLEAMRARSGLQFASNPREFDHSGLPKYGADLSDDYPTMDLYDGDLADDLMCVETSNREESMQMNGAGSGSGGGAPSSRRVHFGTTTSSSQGPQPTSLPNSNFESQPKGTQAGAKMRGQDGTLYGNGVGVFERKPVGKAPISSGSGSGSAGGLGRISQLRQQLKQQTDRRNRGEIILDDPDDGFGSRSQPSRPNYCRLNKETVAYDSDLDGDHSDS